MNSWSRALIGTFGLAAILYGGASLTGGWLGEPPWWQQWVLYAELPGQPAKSITYRRRANFDESRATHARDSFEYLTPRPDRGLISGAIVLTGLVLLAAALWPMKSDYVGDIL